MVGNVGGIDGFYYILEFKNKTFFFITILDYYLIFVLDKIFVDDDGNSLRSMI